MSHRGNDLMELGGSAPTWDVEWAAERAAEAMCYLASFYPEAAGSEALHPYQYAAHDAAMAGDRDRYLGALRSYMRAGRSAALKVRKGAA